MSGADVRRMIAEGASDETIAAAVGWPVLHVQDQRRAIEVNAKRDHVRNVRRARHDMRNAFTRARVLVNRARQCWDYEANKRAHLVADALRAHTSGRAHLARLVALRSQGAPVARGMIARDVGSVWANQALRVAECVAVRDGRALIAYAMPGGRGFYWDVPASLEWADLDGNHRGASRLVRNVSANKPGKRWAADVAKYEGGVK